MRKKQKGILYLTPVFKRFYIYFIGSVDLIDNLNNSRLPAYNDLKDGMAYDEFAHFARTNDHVFNWYHDAGAQYIASEDKKKFREERSQFIDREVVPADCFIYTDDISTGILHTRYYTEDEDEAGYIDVEIVDVRCLNVNICPSTGVIWMPEPESGKLYKKNYKSGHLFKLKRAPVIHYVDKKYKLVDWKNVYTLEKSEKVFEEKLNLFLSGAALRQTVKDYDVYKWGVPSKKRDARAFLYEEVKKITKEKLVNLVSKRIKKVMKVRSIKAAEKRFFQSIVGLRELTKLIKTQTT
jgi:hypothetical protein